MRASPDKAFLPVAPQHSALQHGPRPLPLFLALARQQLADEPKQMAALLQALARYQSADRSFTRLPGAALLHHGKTTLRSMAGLRPDRETTAPQIVFVPSPINAPHVLDMDADCSLMG